MAPGPQLATLISTTPVETITPPYIIISVALLRHLFSNTKPHVLPYTLHFVFFTFLALLASNSISNLCWDLLRHLLSNTKPVSTFPRGIVFRCLVLHPAQLCHDVCHGAAYLLQQIIQFLQYYPSNILTGELLCSPSAVYIR